MGGICFAPNCPTPPPPHKILVLPLWNGIFAWSMCLSSRPKIKCLFSGATFHIPLTKSATLNRLLHCSLMSMAIFRGSFLIFKGSFLHFGGEFARGPRVFSPLLSRAYGHERYNSLVRLQDRSLLPRSYDNSLLLHRCTHTHTHTHTQQAFNQRGV